MAYCDNKVEFIWDAVTIQYQCSGFATSDTSCPVLHVVCSRGTQLGTGSIWFGRPRLRRTVNKLPCTV